MITFLADAGPGGAREIDDRDAVRGDGERLAPVGGEADETGRKPAVTMVFVGRLPDPA
jgi:hypothetical protein